jgi:LDH2 family malate/lactate/ureidoglycolate dehydrogenase
MKVSKNELIASLKKAFEGLGFRSGDYQDAADMVVWLETHGFDGFERLQAALIYLNATKPIHAELVQEDAHNAVLDGRGTSILLCGSEAVDLVRSQVMPGSCAAIELFDCYNRSFIMQRLVKAAQRNYAFIAYWRQLDYCVKVSIEAGAALPEYQTFTITEVLEPQSLRVFCGTSLEAIEKQYALQLQFGTLLETYTGEEMIACYQDSLEGGIEIDEALWRTLDDLVTRVLVPSTDSSRAGAGGS